MNLGFFIIPIRFRKKDSYPFEYLDFCVEAEKYGFSNVYIGEHITDENEDIRSSMLFAAALAAKTKKLNICLSVLPLPHYNIDLLWSQLKDLYLLTEGRLKVGLGPGALNSDLNYMKVDINKRYEIFEKNLHYLIEKIEGSESRFFNLRNNLFSTILSPNPINCKKLKNLNIKILSSNFSNRHNLHNHILCYSSNKILNENFKNWTIAHNYISSEINSSSKDTILSSFKYIHNKLGDKAQSIMGLSNNKNSENTTLIDYKNLFNTDDDFIPKITNTFPINRCDNHLFNIFDCLEDENYVNSLLRIGKDLKKI